MPKRYDLMYQCLNALSGTLTDAGLERMRAGVVRNGLLEIEVGMEDLEAHEESARFVDTLVMRLQRDHGIRAKAIRMPDGRNAGSNVHPWDLVAMNHDGSEEPLPIAVRCRCKTSGKTVSTLHIVLG